MTITPLLRPRINRRLLLLGRGPQRRGRRAPEIDGVDRDWEFPDVLRVVVVVWVHGRGGSSWGRCGRGESGGAGGRIPKGVAAGAGAEVAVGGDAGVDHFRAGDGWGFEPGVRGAESAGVWPLLVPGRGRHVVAECSPGSGADQGWGRDGRGAVDGTATDGFAGEVEAVAVGHGPVSAVWDDELGVDADDEPEGYEEEVEGEIEDVEGDARKVPGCRGVHRGGSDESDGGAVDGSDGKDGGGGEDDDHFTVEGSFAEVVDGFRF